MVKLQMDSATSSKNAKITAPFKRIDFDAFLESVKAKYENEIGTKVGYFWENSKSQSRVRSALLGWEFFRT